MLDLSWFDLSSAADHSSLAAESETVRRFALDAAECETLDEIAALKARWFDQGTFSLSAECIFLLACIVSWRSAAADFLHRPANQ